MTPVSATQKPRVRIVADLA
jgi:malonate decarboxylase alpha subunit